MELLIILLALGAAFLAFFLNSPTVIGAQGERRVHATLSRKLDEKEYILLDDLILPTRNGTTQIDHVVLSRFGIFVIETKNMSGWIFGGKSQARWTQVMHRHKSQFQNPLRQNYHHLKVVQELLGVRFDQLESLVAFVGTAKPKTAMPANVFWSSQGLYKYIASRRVVRLTESEIRDYAEKLRSSALDTNRVNRRVHIHNLRENAARKQIDPTRCPKCGAEMVKRTNHQTGETFLGCSRYPKCRGSRKIE